MLKYIINLFFFLLFLIILVELYLLVNELFWNVLFFKYKNSFLDKIWGVRNVVKLMVEFLNFKVWDKIVYWIILFFKVVEWF